MSDLPIACTLLPGERQSRASELLPGLLSRAESVPSDSTRGSVFASPLPATRCRRSRVCSTPSASAASSSGSN